MHLPIIFIKMKFRIGYLSILLQLLFAGDAFAIPAYPYKVLVKTSNGKETAIFLKGDEHRKYAVSSDGYTLLNDEEGWWYAKTTDNGQIVKSSFKLVSMDDETEDLRTFKASSPKWFSPEDARTKERRGAHARSSDTTEPIIGERRALVILMQFRDVAFKTKNGDFDALFNTIDYHENNAAGSVRDYYRFASQGQLDYISDIYGPYTSEYTMSYYGRNVSNGGSDAHPLDLCIEAMKSLPDSIDFSRYDNNNDGVIDNVHIIFAGYGEEAGAQSSAIWAHEYPHRINLKNEIGYSLAGYSCSPELRGNFGNNISHIGVVCHELGHALGAMDYYDTNYATGGEYNGTGQWDIMASGSWNDGGRTPPNFNPYVRTAIFGWNKVEVLNPGQQISMPLMKSDNAEQTKVFRIDTGSNGDYFLLENRQRVSFDAELPGEGLMIYHIHPNIDTYRSTNTINAGHPQAMYPVCASGSFPSAKNYGEINSDGCPFPGIKNVKSFSPSTKPAALAWNGSFAKVSLSAITINNSDRSISFSTDAAGGVITPDKPDEPKDISLIFSDSYENSILGRMEVLSVIGKSSWTSYRKGDFSMYTEYIPTPTDGKGLLMLFTGKESGQSESEVISQEISIEAGQNYVISFDVCNCMLTKTSPSHLRLYVEDNYGEYEIYSLNKIAEDWEHVEIPLVLAGEKFKYKFWGSVSSTGIFIDNFQLYKEETTSVPRLNTPDLSSDYAVYSLNGVFLGNYNVIANQLRKGIYIVFQNGKRQKVIIR